MAQYETILYEKKDKVAWVTLNRPEVLNALNATLLRELAGALKEAAGDEEVMAIVITGAGDRAFSAGADITGFLTATAMDYIKAMEEARPFELIRNIQKPVIAMVNGLALGGGCEIALACDIVMASERAQFGQPEIRVGVIPGAGGTQVLPRIIGEKKAKELIFTGRFISAKEAESMGLVNKVVPHESLRQEVESLLKDIMAHSPLMLRLAKMAVNKSLEVGLKEGMEFERTLFAVCFSTEDQKEGAKAFLEKRRPEYKSK